MSNKKKALTTTITKEPQSKKISPQVIDVDTLFVGGGPATLGVLANAYQTNRIEALVNTGIAIVETSE
jgi:hypothetical protein